MNKSTIGWYLLAASVIFAGAFALGRYSNKSELKGGGERVLQNRIDSLSNLQTKSDTVIIRIKDIKLKNYETYITDTIYINQIPFDSIKVLFSKEYPRYPNHK